MKEKSTRLNSKSITLLLFSVLLAFSMAFAQNPYQIQFQDEWIDIQENIDTFEWDQMPEYSELKNGYVGWVQFYETPNQATQDLFDANNLDLIAYIPHKTYLFYFPQNTSVDLLRNHGVRAIIPVEGRFKLNVDLYNGDIGEWAIDGDNILVTLEHLDHVTTQFVINDLASLQISITEQFKNSNIINLSIPNNCLDALSNLPYVKWVEIISPPPVHDDTKSRGLHRSNGLDTQTLGGRNYDGTGVGVLTRDDGAAGPHIDFQGRITNYVGPGGTHGDQTSGCMAGAGNLNPYARGSAAGADLHVINYNANFLDANTVNLINDGTVQVTNSSYSNGCNAGYTTNAGTVDTQIHDLETLQHVFSAGNSNGSNCGYGAGSQWGNITGGHKQSKNSLTVGATSFNGNIAGFSSRGPAHDGRIKPDISGHGSNVYMPLPNNNYGNNSGTSFSAPFTAGVVAQLFQVYMEANGGTLPQSALIKAALLNTATDVGNVGPDFKYGWGLLNGLRAGILLEDARYLSSNITQGNTNTHTINVPAGTAQVRFMVYWNDEPATPGASPALVNDLDLVVTDPSTATYLPYLLDHTPNATTLDLPAGNGPDHLNNMEQVLINAPIAGDYDIDISGFNVPMGPQEYFVVYEISPEELTMTYPNAGESFVPGEVEVIHWDALNTTEDFLLEYSNDNGSSWNTITTVGATTYLYSWSVPNEVTGEALVRVTSGGFSDTSDGNFSIARQTTNVDVSQVCPDEATFAWNPVAGAESYDLYILGDKFMEVEGNTTGTSITVPISDPNDEIWFAIVSKNDSEGWVSRRTIAEYHPGGLLNCSLADDLALESINNTESDFNLVCNSDPIIVSVTIRNEGINSQSNFMVSYQLDGEPVVEETYTGTLNSGQQDVYEFSTPIDNFNSGQNSLTARVDLVGDLNPSNDEVVLDFFAITEAVSLDFVEDFETNGVPPPGWIVLNPDNDTPWEERNTIPGSGGSTTDAAFIDNYTYNAPGEEDTIQTLIFDLTNAIVPSLTFDLAKAQYSTTLSDALRVDASIDCGTSYVTIYEKDGLDLSTVPNYVTSNWTPSIPDDWRNEEIDLTPFEGENVIFRFVNINGYGNSTFIDNINVFAEELGVDDFELRNVSIYPNPASEFVTIDINSTLGGMIQVELNNILGQSLFNSNGFEYHDGFEMTLNISDLSSGLYFINIQIEDRTVTKKLVIK